MEIKVWRTSCENPFQTGSKVVKSKKMLYTYAIRIWKRIRTQEVTMGRYLNPGMESFEKSVCQITSFLACFISSHKP